MHFRNVQWTQFCNGHGDTAKFWELGDDNGDALLILRRM
jgi:hypothetical protein